MWGKPTYGAREDLLFGLLDSFSDIVLSDRL